MIKKTISYKDFDGNAVSEDFYFHMSLSEVAELGIERLVKQLQESDKQVEAVMELLRKLVVNSVGIRSEDGRQFIKTKKVRKYFVQTNAYSQMIVELSRDPVAAAAFIDSIMPKELLEELKQTSDIDTLRNKLSPQTPKAAAGEMSREELIEALKSRGMITP
jgi:hypothetical protein